MSIQITGGAGLPTTGGTLTGPLAIAVGSAAAPGLAVAGDSNTGLWAPAADTLAISTGGVEALRVTGAQFVGIGVAAPATVLQVATTLTTSPRGIMSSQHSTGADGARFHMRKSRGTNASPTVIVTGDVLGRLVASGYDGTAYLEMGGIDIVSSGTIGTNRVPTEMRFLVATNAAPSVLTEMVRVTSVGVGIGTSAVGYPLTVNGSISISDAGGSFQLRGSGVAWQIYKAGNNLEIYDITNSIPKVQISAGANGAFNFYNGTGNVIFNGAGNVGIGTPSPTAALHLPASSTVRASLCIPAGTAPTTPVAGDVWAEGTALKFYDGAAVKTLVFV